MNAAAKHSPSLGDDILLLLTLEWLDAKDLVAFDTANQSNRYIRSIWLRVLRSLPDIRCMTGLSYNHYSIRWLIMRRIKTSSMRVVRVSTDNTIDDTFEGIYLPGLDSMIVDCGRKMTDRSVQLIAAGCVNLRVIVMPGCSQLKCSLTAVGQHCRGLTSLDFYECAGIVDEDWNMLAKGCIHLQTIIIGMCPLLTNAALEAIGNSCQRLTNIDMSYNDNIIDGGIAYLTLRCFQLQTVKFAGCSKLAVGALDAIAKSCQGLIYVGMSVNKITDRGITCLTKGCIDLQTIDTAECDQLTDRALEAIGQSCKGLTCINMSYNRNMTDHGILCLTQGCIHLQSITIDDCSELTAAEVEAIEQSCQRLRSIHVHFLSFPGFLTDLMSRTG